MKTINEAKQMLCPFARGACVANECMFWRQRIDYDEYGPNKRFKNQGYCGKIKPQDGFYLKEED